MQIKCFNKSAERFLRVDRSLSVCLSVCVCFLHIFWGRSLRQYYFYSYYFYLYYVVVFFSSALLSISSNCLARFELAPGSWQGLGIVAVLAAHGTFNRFAGEGKRNETKRSIASPPPPPKYICVCVCVLFLRLFFSISVRFKQCARTISFLFTYKIRLFILRWVS